MEITDGDASAAAASRPPGTPGPAASTPGLASSPAPSGAALSGPTPSGAALSAPAPSAAVLVFEPASGPTSLTTTTTSRRRSRIQWRLRKLRGLRVAGGGGNRGNVEDGDEGDVEDPLLSPPEPSTAGGRGRSSSSSSDGGGGSPSGPICLICQEVLTAEEFEAGEAISLQCACRGEMAMRHRKCAIEWSHHKGDLECDICKQPIANLPPIPPEITADSDASSDLQGARDAGAPSRRALCWKLASDCACIFWLTTFGCMLILKLSFLQAEMVGLAVSGCVVSVALVLCAILFCCQRLRRRAESRRRLEAQIDLLRALQRAVVLRALEEALAQQRQQGQGLQEREGEGEGAGGEGVAVGGSRAAMALAPGGGISELVRPLLSGEEAV